MREGGGWVVEYHGLSEFVFVRLSFRVNSFWAVVARFVLREVLEALPMDLWFCLWL